MTTAEFRKQISEGIPEILPEVKPYDPDINHAPKRKDILSPTGSIFVQISNENVHHLLEMLDEIFGHENACSIVLTRKSGWAESRFLPQVHDFILWYAKDKNRLKYRQVYLAKTIDDAGDISGAYAESPDGKN